MFADVLSEKYKTAVRLHVCSLYDCTVVAKGPDGVFENILVLQMILWLTGSTSENP